MPKEKYDTEPRYVISVAARMLETQTYTLRYYEKVGIIEPRRSRGNVRLYSDRDIALLQRVKALVDDMGINLPGEAENAAVLCFRRHFQRQFALRRGYLYFAAEHGHGKRHVRRSLNIVSIPLESWVRMHGNNQIKVASSPQSRLSLSGDAYAGTGVDARRYFHFQTLHVGDNAGSAAHRTGDSLNPPGAFTCGTGLFNLEADGAAGAGISLIESHFNGRFQVLSAPWPRAA